MDVIAPARRARCSGWVALCLLWAAAPAAAQAQGPEPAAARPALEAALVPGTVVWITDAAGREERARVVDVSSGGVTIASGESTRRLDARDVARVRVRHADPIYNGIAIGAASAAGSMVGFCRLMEPWDVCLDAGPIIAWAAIGAGAGWGIDALVRGRRTIYEAGAATLQGAPILTPGGGGLQVRISF